MVEAKENSGTIIFIAIILILIVVVVMCMRSKKREGMSHRVPTVNVLLDNAYGKTILPSYTVKYPYAAIGNVEESFTYESPKKCSYDYDCASDETCVLPGPYTEATGSQGPNLQIGGYCVSNNEPGVPSREGYHWLNSSTPNDLVKSLSRPRSNCNAGIPRTGLSCRPEYYFNEYTDRCEPRFQGTSSPAYIWSRVLEPRPSITIPGSETYGYGVGTTDPYNVPMVIA